MDFSPTETMDHPQKDLLECLLELQQLSLLDEKKARKLELLLMWESNGMLDEQMALSAASNPLFNEYIQNPPSNLAHNSNLLASYGSFNSPSFPDQNPPSNHAYTNVHSELAFTPFDNSTFTNLPQNQPEQRHQPARSSLAMPSQDAAYTHTQTPARVAATPGSPHADDNAHADAAAIVPRPNTVLPPPGIHGLRFESYPAASTASDHLFRAPVNATDDDDVVEVELNKKRHVRSLIDALRCDSYMPAPYEWRGDKNQMVSLTEERKDDWVVWQDRALNSCRSWMKMPGIDVKLECVAWEIFEEILKVHRTGAKLSKLTKARKSGKCSQRVQEAVQALRDWALVRLNMINNHKIPNFAANPKGYAHKVYCYRRNNSGRAVEADAEGEADATGVTGAGGVQGDRRATENGAIAHQCMQAIEVTKRKRKADEAAKEAVNGQQKEKAVAKTKAKPISGLPPSMRDQTSAYNRSPTSRPEPGQFAQYGTMAPPPPPFNDDNHELGGLSGSSASFTPAGLPGHSDNGITAGTNLTFANSIGNNSLETPMNHNPYEALMNHNPYETLMNHNAYGSNQATYGTQTQRHREEEVDHQGRSAAALDVAVPGAMPMQPFQTQSGMPGGNKKKKQRKE
jgi:hypothetical protein